MPARITGCWIPKRVVMGVVMGPVGAMVMDELKLNMSNRELVVRTCWSQISKYKVEQDQTADHYK
jgi:hypothetical protein